MSSKKKSTSSKRSARTPSASASFLTSSVDALLTPSIFLDYESIKNEFTSNKPFKNGMIKELMENEFLKVVKEEVLKEEFIQKSNDLYDFIQTKKDLSASTNPIIHKFAEILYSEKFRAFLTKITGITFNNTIDLFAAVYSNTDKLLCHDDEYEYRRLAYILYLVDDDWSIEDGGCLDLFETDNNNMPSHSVKSIVPKWNSFAFFDVSTVSYHQVAEVTSKNKRISLTGWFHADPVNKPPPILDAPMKFYKMIHYEVDLSQWINKIYMGAPTAKQIANAFVSNSSITLVNFFQDSVFDKIQTHLSSMPTPSASIKIPHGQLASDNSRWFMKGPANRQRYWAYNESQNDDIMDILAKILVSTEFVNLLKKWTNLKLTQKSDALIRKFDQGCYTMSVDKSPEDMSINARGLDVCLVLSGRKIWKSTYGGHTQYLDADEALISFDPTPNMLSLVYRSVPGQMHFVKYLNSKAPTSRVDIEATFLVD